MSYLERLAARLDGSLFAEGDAATTGAGGEQGGGAAAAVAANAAAAAATPTLAQGGGDAGAAAAANGKTNGVPTWPENWREIFAGEDADARKIIDRLASPEDIRKKLVNQEKTISSGAHKRDTLPEGASEEEVAAYRKAVGVPDKPDGYGFAFPETLKPTEADTATLAAFSQYMHERHIPPAAAKAAFDFYTANMTTARTRELEASQEMTLEQMAELRKEFPGKEYLRHFGDQGKTGIGLVGEFLAGHFQGEEKVLDEVLNARLPNGLRVGNYAPFLKGMARMARAYADDEIVVGGDGAGGGKSMDDEYKELIKKSLNPKDMTDGDNARLQELATARTRRDERAASGRRAA